MKKAIILLFIVFSICLNAQWHKTNGPFNVKTRSIHYNGSKIFMGTNNYIYSSANNGTSWQTAYTRQGVSFRRFASKDSIVFAGTDFDGLFRSPDNGKTWERITSGWINSIIVDGNEVYIGGNDGVRKSIDNGNTWSTLNSGLAYSYVFSLAKTNDTLYTAILNSIYKSINKGNTWLPSSSDINVDNLIVNDLKVFDKKIFAGTNKGVYASSNGGKNWHSVNSGLPALPEVFSFSKMNLKIYAATYSGIYASSDDGENWTQFSAGLPPSICWDVIPVNTDLFAALANGGVYISKNSEFNWSESNTNLPKQTMALNCILKDESKIYVGTASGVFVSSDGGNSWINTSLGLLSLDKVVSLGTGSNGIYAGTDSGVFITTNSGLSWNSITKEKLTGSNFHVLPVGSNLIVVGAGIFLSQNNGSSWTKVYEPILVKSLVAVGQTVYVAYTEGILVSTDGGLNWSAADSGIPSPKNISSITICNNNVFAASNGKVYISTNSGKDWTPYHPEQISVNIKYLSSNASQIFGVGDLKKYYVSPSVGAKWSHIASKEISEEYQNTSIAVTVDKDNLYVASNSGVWICPISQMIVNIKDEKKFPTTFSLSQNYPNPFNPETVISWQIAVGSNVTLKVYDVLGREVATLVDEFKTAGLYNSQLSINNLPDGKAGYQLTSGVYFYRLQAGSYSETKKLILMK